MKETRSSETASSAPQSGLRALVGSVFTGDRVLWIIIAALFAFGLWPIGLIALISKLSDKPKKVSSPRSGTRTSTSPNANVTARSTNKVEKTVVKTAKKMNRAPKTSDKTARTLMIIGGIIALAAGSGLISNIGEIIGYCLLYTSPSPRDCS